MTDEKKIKPFQGNVAIIVHILLFALALFFFAIPGLEFFAFLMVVAGAVGIKGYFSAAQGEAYVMVLFGTYRGTVTQHGFFWVNPMYRREKVSVRHQSYSGKVLHVHDAKSIPILVSMQALWYIAQPGKLWLAVDNASAFVQFHADQALREIAAKFRMDTNSLGKEATLVRNRAVVEQALLQNLQSRVAPAGIRLMETRLNELSYAPEVAASFWQLKQVPMVLANKNALAEGALKIAERTLQQIEARQLAEIDAERRASFVQSLVVAICSGQTEQAATTTSFKNVL